MPAPRRALLVNPPAPPGATVNREAAGGVGALSRGRRGFVYPAQRLAECAAGLRARGWRVEGFDLVLRNTPRRARRAQPRASALVVQVCATTLEWDLLWAARTRVRGPVLLLGGPGSLPDVLASDLPVAGEARSLSGATGYGAAARIAGEDAAAAEADPDGWPDADWTVFPLGRKRRLPLFHGRGCIHACSYCPYVLATEGRHLVRSAERTLEEFAAQVRRHRPRRVVFRDPVFGLERPSTLRLLEGIAKLPARARRPFEVETRPEVADPEMIAALVRAGCVELKLGVESFETAALVATRRVGEASAAEPYREAVDRVVTDALRHPGLRLRVFLMSGLPGATPEGEQATQRHFADHPGVEVKPLRPPPVAALA